MGLFISLKRPCLLLLFLICFAGSVDAQRQRLVQAERQPVLATLAPSDVLIAIEVQPPVIRRGQEAVVRVRLRNPRQNEVITLRATAIYTDDSGTQRQAVSNEVTLTVDVSLPVRIDVPAGGVVLMNASATFDGQPISPVSGSNVAFDVSLPGDGADHVLQFRVRPR